MNIKISFSLLIYLLFYHGCSCNKTNRSSVKCIFNDFFNIIAGYIILDIIHKNLLLFVKPFIEKKTKAVFTKSPTFQGTLNN